MARIRRRGHSVWRPVALKNFGGHRWGDNQERITVLLNSRDVWTALLPGLLGNPKLELCAPDWPKSVMSSLRPWPLKGPGTIVFDAGTFASSVMKLVTREQGPVLFPGGAEALKLPTAKVQRSLRGRLRPDGLWHALIGNVLELPVEYGKFLDTGLQPDSGALDLSRAMYGRTEKRTVRLESRPFGIEYQVRTLSCGAVISAIDVGSAADRAGVSLGDVILAVNGQPMFDAKLEEVDRLLEDAEPPLELQVEQPLLAEPMYLRNADLEFLDALVPQRDDDCEERLIRRLKVLLDKGVDMTQGPLETVSPQPAKLFVGSGGSASPMHTDDEPQPQICHVLHGTKFFCMAGPFSPPPGTGEFILSTDEPLSSEVADWLANPQVSFAVCRPGDVIAYSGGVPHMGSNAVASAPCVAIFQALSEHSDKRMTTKETQTITQLNDVP